MAVLPFSHSPPQELNETQSVCGCRSAQFGDRIILVDGRSSVSAGVSGEAAISESRVNSPRSRSSNCSEAHSRNPAESGAHSLKSASALVGIRVTIFCRKDRDGPVRARFCERVLRPFLVQRAAVTPNCAIDRRSPLQNELAASTIERTSLERMVPASK